MSAPALYAQIQGQGVVSADNLNTYEQTCDNIAQIQAFVGLPGMQVFVRGFSVPGDGGQGPFFWSVGTYTNDGINTIVPTGATSGAWLRLTLNQVVVVAPLVTASGTTILKNETFIPIDNTTGSSFAISLPSSPVNGEQHTIKDWAGTAGANNITVSGNGNNIDGSGNYVLQYSYQAINVIFAWGKWGVW